MYVSVENRSRSWSYPLQIAVFRDCDRVLLWHKLFDEFRPMTIRWTCIIWRSEMDFSFKIIYSAKMIRWSIRSDNPVDPSHGTSFRGVVAVKNDLHETTFWRFPKGRLLLIWNRLGKIVFSFTKCSYQVDSRWKIKNQNLIEIRIKEIRVADLTFVGLKRNKKKKNTMYTIFTARQSCNFNDYNVFKLPCLNFGFKQYVFPQLITFNCIVWNLSGSLASPWSL